MQKVDREVASGVFLFEKLKNRYLQIMKNEPAEKRLIIQHYPDMTDPLWFKNRDLPLLLDEENYTIMVLVRELYSLGWYQPVLVYAAKCICGQAPYAHLQRINMFSDCALNERFINAVTFLGNTEAEEVEPSGKTEEDDAAVHKNSSGANEHMPFSKRLLIPTASLVEKLLFFLCEDIYYFNLTQALGPNGLDSLSEQIVDNILEQVKVQSYAGERRTPPERRLIAKLSMAFAIFDVAERRKMDALCHHLLRSYVVPMFYALLPYWNQILPEIAGELFAHFLAVACLLLRRTPGLSFLGYQMDLNETAELLRHEARNCLKGDGEVMRAGRSCFASDLVFGKQLQTIVQSLGLRLKQGIERCHELLPGAYSQLLLITDYVLYFSGQEQEAATFLADYYPQIRESCNAFPLQLLLIRSMLETNDLMTLQTLDSDFNSCWLPTMRKKAETCILEIVKLLEDTVAAIIKSPTPMFSSVEEYQEWVRNMGLLDGVDENTEPDFSFTHSAFLLPEVPHLGKYWEEHLFADRSFQDLRHRADELFSPHALHNAWETAVEDYMTGNCEDRLHWTEHAYELLGKIQRWLFALLHEDNLKPVEDGLQEETLSWLQEIGLRYFQFYHPDSYLDRYNLLVGLDYEKPTIIEQYAFARETAGVHHLVDLYVRDRISLLTDHQITESLMELQSLRSHMEQEDEAYLKEMDAILHRMQQKLHFQGDETQYKTLIEKMQSRFSKETGIPKEDLLPSLPVALRQAVERELISAEYIYHILCVKEDDIQFDYSPAVLPLCKSIELLMDASFQNMTIPGLEIPTAKQQIFDNLNGLFDKQSAGRDASGIKLFVYQKCRNASLGKYIYLLKDGKNIKVETDEKNNVTSLEYDVLFDNNTNPSDASNSHFNRWRGAEVYQLNRLRQLSMLKIAVDVDNGTSGGEDVLSSPAFGHFKCNGPKTTDDFNRMLLVLALKYVLDNYRNKISHKELIDKHHADECRELMLEAENLIWIMISILNLTDY